MVGERLYRITVEAITLFQVGAKPSTSGSFGALLEEAVDDGERVRWKKVGGPMVNDESPEAALSDLTEALKHYGGVDAYRDAIAQAKDRAA